MQYCQLQILLVNQLIERANNRLQLAQKLLAFCTHLLQQDLNRKQKNWVQEQEYVAQEVLKKIQLASYAKTLFETKNIARRKNVLRNVIEIIIMC